MSTISFIAGGAATVVGGIVFFSAPSRVMVTPTASAREGGLVVRGTFRRATAGTLP